MSTLAIWCRITTSDKYFVYAYDRVSLQLLQFGIKIMAYDSDDELNLDIMNQRVAFVTEAMK